VSFYDFVFVEHYSSFMWVFALLLFWLCRKYASAMSDKIMSVFKKYSFLIILNILTAFFLFGFANSSLNDVLMFCGKIICFSTLFIDLILIIVYYRKAKKKLKGAKDEKN